MPGLNKPLRDLTPLQQNVKGLSLILLNPKIGGWRYGFRLLSSDIATRWVGPGGWLPSQLQDVQRLAERELDSLMWNKLGNLLEQNTKQVALPKDVMYLEIPQYEKTPVRSWLSENPPEIPAFSSGFTKIERIWLEHFNVLRHSTLIGPGRFGRGKDGTLYQIDNCTRETLQYVTGWFTDRNVLLPGVYAQLQGGTFWNIYVRTVEDAARLTPPPITLVNETFIPLYILEDDPRL